VYQGLTKKQDFHEERQPKDFYVTHTSHSGDNRGNKETQEFAETVGGVSAEGGI